MYTILIMGLIGIIVSIIIAYKNQEEDFSGYSLTGLFGIMFGVILGMMFAIVIYEIAPKQIEISKCKIISLNDKSSLSGTFVLGTGTISEKGYYVFYKESNGISQHKVLVDVTKIYEDSKDSTGYIEIFRTKLKESYRNWGNNFKSKYYFDSAKIHVPKGTIIRQFRLDSE